MTLGHFFSSFPLIVAKTNTHHPPKGNLSFKRLSWCNPRYTKLYVKEFVLFCFVFLLVVCFFVFVLFCFVLFFVLFCFVFACFFWFFGGYIYVKLMFLYSTDTIAADQVKIGLSLNFYCQKKVAITFGFLTFWSIWRHSGVTRWCVFWLIWIEGTKTYTKVPTQHHKVLVIENLWGLQQPPWY